MQNLINWAHEQITRIKGRDYAPNVHEIQSIINQGERHPTPHNIMIQISDILQVADRLKIKVTNRDVMWVLDNYEESSDPSATWDLIVENLLYQMPMPTIEEFLNSENDMLYFVEWDMSVHQYEGYFFGRVTDNLNFCNTMHCGCERDCCGCLSSVSQTAKQVSENTILITKTYQFNY